MGSKSKLDVFSYNSYKSLIRDSLTGPEHRGKMSAAADFMGCQRSYLSRVIKEKVHLTSDASYKLTKFLNFSEDQRDYFLLLVEYARSNSKDHKHMLFEKMRTIKLQNDSLFVRSKRSQFVIDSNDVSYFSSWIPTAIHLLTSIPAMQTAAAISRRLNLSEEQVVFFLKKLESNNFVTYDGKLWKFKDGEVHLTKDSPLVHFHHQNWRSRAIVNAQTNSEDIHSTFIYTLSIEDIEKIKSLILTLISELASIASPSEPQECVAFVCDFFKV